MSEKLVYLGGTITPNPIHLKWREHVASQLDLLFIQCINPVRGKNPADWDNNGFDANEGVVYSKGGFVERDLRDVKRCDLIFCNFSEPLDRQSIGTWWELGWADMLGKPIVIVSTLPEVINHPFVWKRAARVCFTLDEGIGYTRFLLED